jgi:hypothetical protein
MIPFHHRRSGSGWARVSFALSYLVAAAALPSAPLSGQGANGGNGTIYWANYGNSILVVDEATMQVTDEIGLTSGIPRDLHLSHDRSRFYVRDATNEHIEVVDIAGRRSLGSFTLSQGSTRVRISNIVTSPDDSYAILFARATSRLSDRFEIGDPFILKYDLVNREVIDTISIAGQSDRTGGNILFSDSGESAYLLSGGSVLVLETEGFTEVDRWEGMEPEPGFGRVGLSFPNSPHQIPGFYTSLVRITDPIQGRQMMGFATVDLEGRKIEFNVLGPSESVSFQLAPGGKTGYGLTSSIGRYEFWTFDIEAPRIERRATFPGRPRMSLAVSSNGRYLYIHNAGNTIDIYDAETYEHVHQVVLDGDMTDFVLVPAETPQSDR